MCETDDSESGKIDWPELEAFLRGLSNDQLVKLVAERLTKGVCDDGEEWPRTERTAQGPTGRNARK